MTPTARGHSALAVLLGIAATIALVGCGSSGGQPATTSPGSTPAGTSPSQRPSTSASQGTNASAATVAAIKDAYTKVFASSTPEQVSLRLLQDGPAFKSTIDQQATTSLAQTAGAEVSTVRMQSPNLAKVIFTITLGGNPVLKDRPGYAVREDGTWKVAGKTFCDLLTLQGDAPAVCKSPAATTLPH